MALDAEGAQDDAERQVERLEHRPLLDVQLQIGGGALELRARVERAVEIHAVSGHGVGKRRTAGIHPRAQLLLVGHRAGRGGRAEERAAEACTLFVGPVDEANRQRRRPFLGEPAQHLEARDDVERAVEPAAVRHRIDVTADQQRPIRAAA